VTIAALVVVRAAVEALDEYLDLERLGALSEEEIKAAWKTAGEVCRDADHIYTTLRCAMTRLIADRPHAERSAPSGNGETT
jgi:hypothetical protein